MGSQSLAQDFYFFTKACIYTKYASNGDLAFATVLHHKILHVTKHSIITFAGCDKITQKKQKIVSKNNTLNTCLYTTCTEFILFVLFQNITVLKLNTYLQVLVTFLQVLVKK